ncbi:BREX-2 system adenine-specific DNA-methyltransferase PglX [Mycobacterium intracellulare]|uniref:BREX-2 system adenine-specific DNA-methyltransferase PglX n=1 Tax=Mycobacterium intracellulare TaxID=1767 RepID=UPI001CDA5505|nr:BREX-2 system adenine-specific DNA-methyltransferase PglX [Mycobacterium intracellulare]MCA2249966.1 BREX-2 system adenine-specific DNA-methyltransferase PglX [Mycobacterium intracellulare]
MSPRETLTSELRAEVLRLEDDLRARVTALPDVQKNWRSEYEAARAAERTAAAWEVWVDERVTLAAVAWVLTTVFIRFCEDNGLVKPVWISGPRSREAIEAQQQFLRETARTNPDVTDREWLLQATTYLQSLPATAGLVDETSPMWLVTPSGDAATRLVSFWRERDESGGLIRELTDTNLETRFLGDLYQEISEDAKKRYALRQTPVFVEEFILDRTLEPALNERPLEGFKMIDPTCGSGHFLLGGFQRLLDRWHKQFPALDERERVQGALDSVYGVDLNPFAVAIARFRLTVAALKASGLSNLEDAPAFKYHLAAGDSLLHGLDQREFELGSEFSIDQVAANFSYATENFQALKIMLREGQYDCVVGNPPYIQVKDPGLNELYRNAYRHCRGTYALTVPFLQRFFALAKSTAAGSGWVGQIVGNAFMKQQFGKPLVEKYIPTRDLKLIVNLAGVPIPGHGTPTVILVGRNRNPTSDLVRVVLSVKGEPGHPPDPAQGHVWTSIARHVDDIGWGDEWITVRDIERKRLGTHPWSLSGGGALELLETLDSGTRVLDNLIGRIGYSGQTNADPAFVAPRDAFVRRGVDGDWIRQFVPGEVIRDFEIRDSDYAIFPYADGKLRDIDEHQGIYRWLWPVRTVTWSRATFSKVTYREDGRTWWEWHQIALDRVGWPFSLAYPNLATHNHFALDRKGRVFNPHAPFIQLRVDASIERYQELLGYLNTSVVCFWLKQNSHDRGVGGIGGGIGDEAWEPRYEFTGATLKRLPIPASLPSDRGEVIDRLSQELSNPVLRALEETSAPTRAALDERAAKWKRTLSLLVFEQEELDWETYSLWGLVDEDLTYRETDIPTIVPGQRAFEIVLARRIRDGDEESAWFNRHGSTPMTEPPDHWPPGYRHLVERRITQIETHPYVGLLERPENKRRWVTEAWNEQEERALRTWLLRRLEESRFWFDAQGRPNPKSLAVLADEVARDQQFASTLSLWEGRLDVPVTASLAKLIASECVPYLAAFRYKESGMRKRAAWESTWEIQRREDTGRYNPAPTNQGGDGPVPVPPRYISADFARPEYWSNRGKLDVPKERFVLYPGAGRDGDQTPVLGWAGWDHAQQSLALAALIQSGEQQGFPDDRLIPLVAGLSELLPWVDLWHGEPDALYGGSSPAEFFSELLDGYMVRLGATRESLAHWRPQAPTRGRKARP